mmetsp:Transcript_7931/g.13803  ORF Transcript_7931/g.13803 Transcript_7931/m.13803 type:complete len:393 (+) Transcript_7931:82-1260(+)
MQQPSRSVAKAQSRLRSAKDRRGGCFFHIMTYALLASTTLFWAYFWAYQVYFTSITILPVTVISSESSIIGSAIPFQTDEEEEDEASSIVRRAYELTYAHMVPCDETLKGLDCWQKTIDYFQPHNRKFPLDDAPNEAGSSTTDKSNPSTTPPSIPWWWQTFLRDLKSNGAFGHWHELSTAKPPIEFCSIEKVGSSAWHDVFCNLNPKSTSVECAYDEVIGKEICHNEIHCQHQSQEQVSTTTGAHRAVFLRDPLERLLSAYIDKCHNNMEEKHCEPNVVFSPHYQRVGVVTDDIIVQPLLEDVEDNDKQMFAAYLDVMPLKWNLHVLPQALACDLYRNIDQYDFVGHMDEDFYFDLEKMAKQYGGPLPMVLNESFGYQNTLQEARASINMQI